MLDADLDLLVALLQVLGRLLRLFLGPDDGGLLLDDEGVEVLEEAGQFRDGLLDLEELVVACADGAQDGGCLAGSVGSELWEGGLMSAWFSCTGYAAGRTELTAVWKMPSLPQSASAAWRTSSSDASGLTMRYCLAIWSR